MIHVLTILFFSSLGLAKVDKTFLVKTLGNKDFGERLLKELTKQECYPLGGACHAFQRYENESQIKGRFTEKGSFLLYQVNITNHGGKDRFNLQIFQRDGKKLRRVRNAGNFTPQDFAAKRKMKITDEEFFQSLLTSTITLSFK